MIYLFRVRVSFVACRMLLADTWMMIYALSLPVCRVRVRAWYVFCYGWILFKCGYIRFMLLVFILFVRIFRTLYIGSTLLLCTHIVGRFFARVYLYIA